MKWLIPAALLALVVVFVYQHRDTIEASGGVSFAEGITVMQSQMGDVNSSLTGVEASYSAIISQKSSTSSGASASSPKAEVAPESVGQDALTLLMDDWNYQYEQSRLAYIRFTESLTLVESRADAYFQAQQAHTDKYNNPELKAKAAAADAQERQQYRNWLNDTREFQRELYASMQALEDVDTNLQKIGLRKDLSSISDEFDIVPAEIVSLQEQLDVISAEADAINDEITLFFE